MPDCVINPGCIHDDMPSEYNKTKRKESNVKCLSLLWALIIEIFRPIMWCCSPLGMTSANVLCSSLPVVTELEDVVSVSVESQKVAPGTGYMVCQICTLTI